VSLPSKPLVEARGLHKAFRRAAGVWGGAAAPVQAVNGVDLDVHERETLGLVGESGSGKSTLGRLLIRLLEPDAGSIHFDGVDLLAQKPGELRKLRKQFQIIFQDAFGSLNPRMRVASAVGEPLAVHRLAAGKAERLDRVRQLLEQVGLDGSAMTRYPHQFSGGQRQRIGIARAIACSPRFIVADEPVSALDPPVQAQIINLMIELQEKLDLAYLFIAHDLRLVEHICDRVMVMYLGRIVEQAPAGELYAGPLHPYTRALLASTPTYDPEAVAPPVLPGEPPSQTSPPSGCPFHPRCPEAVEECSRARPGLIELRPGHRVACHLAGK
jgi:oligopeptide/dipeptide ABC transporter ATP-binding protein